MLLKCQGTSDNVMRTTLCELHTDTICEASLYHDGEREDYGHLERETV
jgi:hypothetical protein